MAISEDESNAYFKACYQVITPAAVLTISPLGNGYLRELHENHGAKTSALIWIEPLGAAAAAKKRGRSISGLRSAAKKRWNYLPAESCDSEGHRQPYPGILVLDISCEEAIALAVKFGQKVIIFSAENGNSRLVACRSEDQAVLIHPLERMANRLNARLSASGRKVVKRKSREGGPSTATFPSIRPPVGQGRATARPARVVIAKGTDDTIDEELLRWSGFAELWNGDDDGNEPLCYRYSFLKHVVEHCNCVDIDCDEWDGGAPGQSGFDYKVSTTDPAELKREMLARITALAKGLR